MHSNTTRRLAHILKASPAFDILFLVLICVFSASNWINSDLPAGHDALATVNDGAAIKNYLTTESAPFQNMISGSLTSSRVGCLLLHFGLAIISFAFAWAIAAKALFLLLVITSALSAYLFVYELTRSRPASFVAGLAYVFAPYYLIEVVFEGHWSFGAQYMLTPLVFLMAERAIQQPRTVRIVAAGLCLALLICLGHPQTLPTLVGPFLALYMAFRIWLSGKKRAGVTTIACLLVFSIGLSLTAFWWLPLLREISFFQAPYALEASEPYKGTLLQVLALRPSLCCAPSSAYDASASGVTSVLLFIPFTLAIVGAVLNYRNRYVWFFSATILMTWLLAMGSTSPIPLLTLAHKYIPFFSSLRTPVRFLLLTSFAYAILIGFCIKGVLDWLNRANLSKLRHSGAILLTIVSACLILTAGTWHEARAAYSTFKLSADQKEALAFLTDQDDGNYRVADALFQTAVSTPNSRYILNPTYWLFAHGKQTLPGGLPESNAYTTNLIESLQTDLSRDRLDMSQWLSLLNLKYVVLDKTQALSSNVVLDESFERVWTSDTIDIYENHAVKPPVFSVTAIDEHLVSLYADGTINLTYAGGTQQPLLSLSNLHVSSSDLSLKSTYSFSVPGDHACLEANVKGMAFRENDAFHLVYYSERDIADVHLSLELIETDGSRYDVVLGSVDGIKKGWNEVNLPLSLLTLRYSTDENAQLDVDQIYRLWIGVGRQGNSDKSEEFALYFDSLSIVTQETNSSLEYTKVRPGKYQVHVNSDSPTCLALSEAYNPNWVARVNGEAIHSQLVYQALNGFYLEAGEYDITLEFVNSPLRIAGNIITWVTICILCLLGVFVLVSRWLMKRRAVKNLIDHSPPQDES